MPSSHGPIQDDAHAMMNAVAKALDHAFNPDLQNKKFGFALLVFPFGEAPSNRMNYICNAHRDDMIAALKEFISRNEGTHPEEASAVN